MNELLLLGADFTKFQFTNGTRNPDQLSPDVWNMDQFVLDRPGNKIIQLALFYDYRNNLKLYPSWQEFFRTYQPPTLVAWGKTIYSLEKKRALALQKDLKDCEVHLLNTDHFPFEEDLEISAALIKQFLGERLK
ncbi:alpha/beta fold hydrolase [Bacillus sp. V2I10]|uniref:alpha/beta fold hydrolase n=1 Tax=Bacillus sp. V2I10 TaxID=3042276 RepID=UPI00277DCF41|nr:hypothetical protein [Bacillus sp. V2I10]MDQ0859494.1 hypothetical protein [Bacillus sp. V2I10]